MFTIPELTANALGSYLAERMRLRFGSTDGALIERVEFGCQTCDRVHRQQ